MSELHLVSLNSLPTVSEVSGRTQLVNSLLSGFIVPHWLMSNVSRTTLSGIFVPIKKKNLFLVRGSIGFLLLPSWPEVELTHVQL